MTSVRIRPGFRRLAPLTRYISTHAVLAVTASVGGLVILGLTAASAAVYDAVAEKDGVSSLDRPALAQVIAWRTPLADRIFTGFTHLGGPRELGRDTSTIGQLPAEATIPPHLRAHSGVAT